MALKGSADVGFLLVSGMDVMADVTDIEDEQPDIVEETTTLGVAAQTYGAVGLGDYMLSQKGFYNDAANRSNAAFVSPGRVDVLCYAPEGNTVGARVACSELTKVSYKRLIAGKALTKAEVTYESSKGHDEAILLHILGDETEDADGEASYYDGAAGSSAGATAYLQVKALNLDGYDSVTISIEDSADHSTWAELLAFTDVTAIGAERKTVAGTVDRYLTWKVVFNGSGTSPSVTFMVAIKRN